MRARPNHPTGPEGAERWYQAAFDDAPDAMVVLDDDARFVDANPAACALIGLGRSELRQRSLAEFVPDREFFARHWAMSLRDGSVTGQGALRRVDGRVRDVQFAGTTHFAPGLHFCVLRDVSAVKRAEQALTVREELFRALVENSSDVVLLLSGAGAVRYVSRSVTRVLGHAPEDDLGRSVFDLIHPADAERIRERFSECVRRPGEPCTAEFRMRHRDGGWRLVEALGVSRLEEPSVNAVVLNVRDVTDRRQAQEDLRLRERVIEGMSQGLLIADATRPDRPIIYVNPAFERITGYAAAEVLGRNPRFLQGERTDVRAAQRIKEALRRGEPVSVEILNYRKDGSTYWNQLAITPIRDPEGRLTHFVGLQTDVTERRHLEDQLRQAQKMEAVGTLAGGVAHDFNNMLTVVNGYSDQVLRKLGPQDPLRQKVEEIRRAGERAGALTRQLLAFSRKQVLAPRVIDLNAVVTGLEKMLRRLIGEHIDMVMVPGRDLTRVKVDPGQVEQVLMNLVVNARDALPAGGRIRLETENVTVRAEDACRVAGLRPGSYVLLTVSDDGVGMDAATLSHVFEPFFTTKPAGKGTGLGLSTVYGIVKQSGGYVGVASAPGQGATFRVYLPATDEPLAASGPDEARSARAARAATVLVVEDDATVRALVCASLADAGYRVLEARHAGEALELAERYKGPIDLVLTDLVMPQMDGRELARRVTAARPQVRALFMSGYAEPDLLHGIPDGCFLAKPFTMDALALALGDMLSAS